MHIYFRGKQLVNIRMLFTLLQIFYNNYLKMISKQSKNQLTTQGNAVFRQDLSKALKKLISYKKIKRQLSKACWVIYQQNYKKQNWKDIFQAMSTAFNQQLWLNNNYYPQIISQIESVDFRQLKVLALHKNNITSIQAIGSLNCPNLTQIWLRNNNITKINVLKKLCNFNIAILYLQQNYILQINPLCLSKFNKNLFEVALKSSLAKTQDLSQIIKFGTSNIKHLQMGNFRPSYFRSAADPTKGRICQNNVAQMIQQRFPEIQTD